MHELPHQKWLSDLIKRKCHYLNLLLSTLCKEYTSTSLSYKAQIERTKTIFIQVLLPWEMDYSFMQALQHSRSSNLQKFLTFTFTSAYRTQSNKTYRAQASDELTVSINFRFSRSWDLSLISPEANQDLIWSRNLWSFLISFLRSASYFSFWLLLEALWTFCQMSSNCSTPSATFFRHRSISPVTEEWQYWVFMLRKIN